MRPDDHVIVIAGATGDLAKRKLLPGLCHLDAAGLLPENYRIIGSAPSSEAMSDEQFREHARDSIEKFGNRDATGDQWDAFEQRLSFASADGDDATPLVNAVDEAEKQLGGNVRRLFHLAIPPVAFGSMVTMLGASGLAKDARVIIEKPFGTDLASAKALNETVHSVFDESRVFRIDHYLGKETVDNLLAFRFANGLFEPIWSREYIDNVQIDVPEALSIEGRAAFYEKTGCFRDMVVTHLFQVLGFLAMEEPASLEAGPLRDAKHDVFGALRPLDPARVVRGQYDGYRDAEGVAPDSDTETFVAVEAHIDNPRWRGVPFFLRAGKSLAQGAHSITLELKRPGTSIFGELPRKPHNAITFDLGEPGAIEATILAKKPGPDMHLGTGSMTFRYQDSFAVSNDLEGYERLILDAMLGNQTLFTRADSIERLWEIATPLVEHPEPVQPYAQGSWGPDAADELVAPSHWHVSEYGAPAA
jgi:glucose-6-phosphate 1-dehydrogenase